MKKKVLVIRFSSIGDIIQCMSVVDPLNDQLDADVHWISRSDLTPMLSTHPNLHKIWSYDKKTGLIGLVQLVNLLRKEKFDYVYDAHQNIRSLIVRMFIGFASFNPNINFTLRRKHRFRRFLFFQLNIKKALKMPFRAVRSFQDPIAKWGVRFDKTYDTLWTFNEDIVNNLKNIIAPIQGDEKVITLVPSAAWELKRWPVHYWKELVMLLPDYKFVIIAGPNDTFTEDIKAVAPANIVNLAGKTSIQESFYIISQSKIVISADTGFLHAADLFNINSIALMGPTAFGHPTGKSVKVMEVDGLHCRPCTKAGNTSCKLPNESRDCLMNSTPQKVLDAMKQNFNI